VRKIIDLGYAGNQTEVIRQALLSYNRMIEEEEVRLVNKGVVFEIQEIKEGKTKTKTLDEIKKKYRM
jgi:hypothetical protein